MEFKPVQLKAPSPIEFTVSGITTFVKLVHPANAFSPIDATLSNNFKFFICIDIIHVNHKKIENQNSMWYNVFCDKNK